MSLHFSPYDNSYPMIFQMCFIRSTVAYQCPNIKFDVLDVSFDAQCNLYFVLDNDALLHTQIIIKYVSKNM